MGTEIWVVATGGAYGAAMVATPEAKPGLLLDRMESHLLSAEETRSNDTQEPAMAAKVVDLSAAAQSRPGAHERPRPQVTLSPPTPDVRPTPPPPPAPPAPAKPGNVDRVALAREFSRLLDDEPRGDR